ncbi:MAG: hypothetical protein Q7J82_10510 [Coriobacteriia bacterium]|nr:hypothetical protein [Coriobacteriia bacterium]
MTAYEYSNYDAAFADFLGKNHGYRDTSHLDTLRATDYGRLDRLGHVYLDYTGGGLYAESQVAAHHELLSKGIYGNPHSHDPTSLAATVLVEEARDGESPQHDPIVTGPGFQLPGRVPLHAIRRRVQGPERRTGG